MSQAPQEITVKGKATRIRGATWTHDQVKKLFQVWTQPDIYNGLLNEKKKLDIFKNMASILSSLGVNRTWRECRAKIKNLKADFRKAMDKKTPFRYYDEMKKIMNLDGSATRSGGGEVTIDTYFSPIAASTPHSSQHSFPSDEQQGQDHEVILSDHENEDDHFTHHSPLTPERTTSIIEPVPSTSRSVIQSTPRKTMSPYRSPGHSFERTRSYDPLSPSTSSKYPYSPISEQTPHRSPFQYTYYESQDEHREDWRQLEEQEHRMSRGQKDTSNEPVTDHDSSSRSSMIITHVVSNVIEPVTQIVMPSSSGTGPGDRLAASEDIEIVKQPLIVDDQLQTTPPPIRLEFVLDDDNVILQTPQSPSHDADVTDSAAADETQPTIILPTSPPPSTSKALPTSPPSQILRQRLKQQRLAKKASKSQYSQGGTPSSPPTPARPKPPVKRRKLFETLNKKTVETISDLLTETSQNLLQELQDAEQRFIVWEEEKRKEERKREEAMFAKLITAMKPAAASGHVPPQEENDPTVDTLASDFSSVSKRINDLVCGEVKQTEESVRQWELKMQRQESRHTEKLFAMIINAIKVSSSTTLLDG